MSKRIYNYLNSKFHLRVYFSIFLLIAVVAVLWSLPGFASLTDESKTVEEPVSEIAQLIKMNKEVLSELKIVKQEQENLAQNYNNLKQDYKIAMAEIERTHKEIKHLNIKIEEKDALYANTINAIFN